jgi:tRNA(Ile)-lysidine synthase
VRSFDWIRLIPKGYGAAEEPGYRFAVSVPGRYRVPGTTQEISLEPVEGFPGAESGYNTERKDLLDSGRIPGPLELRSWRPGDRYRPVGDASQVKLKRLFQLARVPVWARRKWPIIISEDTILWAAGFGPSAEHAATPASRTIVRIRERGGLLGDGEPRFPA